MATALDTVGNSTAEVTAGAETLKLGGLDVGPLDANAALDQLAALANIINGTLQGVLHTVASGEVSVRMGAAAA